MTLPAAYVVVLWLAAGYCNTCAYSIAPQLVDGAHKATANGLLALAYQVSHCSGLAIALLLEIALYHGV